MIPAIICLSLLFSCTRESFTNNSNTILRAGQDSLYFDSVFTSTGSITQSLKLFNDNSQGIHISAVKLIGGNTSPFKINIDGLPGPFVNQVDIAAGDSVYIFVSVNINPNSANLPFVVRDSIEIDYNGNHKFIQLEAYGRNAHFYRGRIITANEIWNNDLPYVILNKLEIANKASLTINPGCRIYIHADAPFIINGTLLVNGEKYDSTRVVFSGDRLDDPYKNFPAAYPGLIFTDSSGNSRISFGIIKNAYQGITVNEPSVLGTKLTLNETIIDNAFDGGLIGINTSITATNLLVSNCGKNIILAGGGNYNFIHCTAAAYSNSFIQHKDPILQAANYIIRNNTVVSNPISAVFRNSIFWSENNGLTDNEVTVSKYSNSIFNVSFDHILWRVKNNPSNSTITSLINGAPEFDSVNIAQMIFNFRLKATSPAVNSGANAGIAIDLDGNPRPVGLPDLGCYEKQ